MASFRILTLNCILIVFDGGGGQIEPCDEKNYEKFLCSHHNNNALIKEIFLFDTALAMKNQRHWSKCPPPHTMKD